MDKISVYIADSQCLTRTGVINILNGYYNNNIVFTEIFTWETLIGRIKTQQPQLIIVDFELLDLNNLNDLSEIKRLAPLAGFLILTDNKNATDVPKILNLGINNYVLKSCSDKELIEGVSAALQNKKYFSPEILDILIDQRSKNVSQSEQGKLTTSEVEIVKLIAQGLTTKEIADKRNLSFHTIITHRKNIFRKLAINSTSELMMYAMRNGLIDSLEYYI